MDVAETSFRMLSQQALAAVATTGRPVEDFRGTAHHDTERDGVFSALEGFEPAATLLAKLPVVAARFGTAWTSRLALQFIYELLNRSPQPSFDETQVSAV